jgi:GNAT superfamily N-acetyltransferase
MNLPHRRAYSADPGLCDRVFDLLVTWIPQLRPMRDAAAKLDWRWEDCSTPFVVEREGRVTSHVGVLEQTWVMGGVERRMGGIHAVCTLESERRQGLYRVLMEEVLAHCEARYETIELSTENPEYYEPFGFRIVPEHRFVARVDAPAGPAGFRKLDLTEEEDAQRLQRLLASRSLLSTSFGVVRETQVFKFNEAASDGLLYCEELDVIVSADHKDDGTLELNDVVAAEMPRLRDLLARARRPVGDVIFHFNPEHLDVEARPERTTDGDCLMVRGEFPYHDGPVPLGMIPPTSRH